MEMFCNQCEQASGGTGCTVMGVCGKVPDCAALQDVLLHGLKGMAYFATRAQALGRRDADVDAFLLAGLFSTVTNVEFDEAHLVEMVRQCATMKNRAQALFEEAWKAAHTDDVPAVPSGPASWVPADDAAGLVSQGHAFGVDSLPTDVDVRSTIHILTYGIKGVAAYAHHAHVLGRDDEEVMAFLHLGLAATANPSLGLEDYVKLSLECGRINLRVMEVLYEAHVGAYGKPEPSPVNLGTRAGKCILVSGHDMKMLELVLQQTEGKGINVYTHGEMLTAHGYPGLKKYTHLAGHFGTAWQNQAREMSRFPGAIIFNTNCIQRPHETYVDRLFTWGQVTWPGVAHIDGWDFTPVIEKALACPEFEDKSGQVITVGFGHDAVLSVAPQVIEAVKGGKIRHFFLIGGCDGAKSGRNYYTRFAERVPKDCVVMTLACGKYRFNRHEFGDINGIPRLLDLGQCNDAYSAVRIATALAGAFECGVNDLPLSLIISWYEQKAVAILLTLLHLGIKNVRLGPSLPAFVSPNVLDYLVKNFQIAPITTVDADLTAILGSIPPAAPEPEEDEVEASACPV